MAKHSEQVERGRRMLESVLSEADLAAGELPWDDVFRVLDDVQRPPADEIPDTGAHNMRAREVEHNITWWRLALTYSDTFTWF